MSLFDYPSAADSPYPSYGWFNIFLPITTVNRPVHILAENVIALVLLPKLSNADQDNLNQTYAGSAVPLCPRYAYDSTLTVNPGGYTGGTTGLLAALNPKNQLPPIVTVTMVAIDERSAERLSDKYCTSANQSTPSLSDATMGLSQSMGATYSGLFANSLNLETPLTGDLALLEAALTKEKCSYRVFTTNVTIRGAKWSRSQTK